MTSTITRRFHLSTQSNRRGGFRRVLRPGSEHPVVPAQAAASPAAPVAATPQVHPLARRMAMAIACQRLIRGGAAADAASLASAAGISRARMTQLLNFTMLSPDIQEALLTLPGTARIGERHLRPLMRQADWTTQRQDWAKFTTDAAEINA